MSKAIKEQALSGGGFFYGWIVLLAAFGTLFLAAGTRSTFGIFLKPMSDDLGWSRAGVSLAMSLFSVVHGFSQPVFGRLVDRYGPKIVILLNLTVMGFGLMAMATTSGLWQLYLIYGVVSALGFSGTSNVSTSALVVRWFRRRRAFALSLSTAGMSAGQLVIIPLTMSLILGHGWRTTYLILGLLLLGAGLPLVLGLIKNSPGEVGSYPDGAHLPDPDPVLLTEGAPATAGKQQRVEAKGTGLREAWGTWPFRLLALGFFVCGFTITMITTHLASFAIDHGMSGSTGANALALVGGVAVIGVLSSGVLCDRFGRKRPLGTVYFLRGLALLSLLLVQNEPMLYLSAIIIGLSYTATVPPTTALLADIYGASSLGTLFGTISLGHQIGSALGAYLGGALYDATGSYNAAFFLAALAGFTAAAASFRIKETRPLPSRPILADTRLEAV